MQRNPRGNCVDLCRLRILWGVEVDGQERALLGVCGFKCQPSAAGEDAVKENQRAVGIANVVFGADGIRTGGSLPKRISGGNVAVFGTTVFGAPAAGGDAALDGSVERSAIDASLATGNHGKRRASRIEGERLEERLGMEANQRAALGELKMAIGIRQIIPERGRMYILKMA
jgi:hypothetical protein